MNTLYILIDTSTKPPKEKKMGYGYGKSAAFWCAWEDDIEASPSFMGIIFREIEGKNKIFYDGILSALIACEKYKSYTKDIRILGDNECVIKQLRHEMNAMKLKEYRKLAEELAHRYSGKITYEYISKNDPVYKKVDELAKWAREHVPRQYTKAGGRSLNKKSIKT